MTGVLRLGAFPAVILVATHVKITLIAPQEALGLLHLILQPHRRRVLIVVTLLRSIMTLAHPVKALFSP